jgi:hypothetical protein
MRIDLQRLPLTLSLKHNNKNNPTNLCLLTESLHIREVWATTRPEQKSAAHQSAIWSVLAN